MKAFTQPDFQNRLSKIIAELEQESQIETVVLIRQSSADYEDVPLSLAADLALLTLTALLAIPLELPDYQVYFITLTAFGMGLILGLTVEPLKRLLVTKKRKQRSVELMARAAFQKGGLHHTQTEIGTLIYCSLLERQVFIVADRGAQMAIPAEEWQKIEVNLQSALNSKDAPDAFLQALSGCKDTFKRYIPALAHNPNELPDNLQINL